MPASELVSSPFYRQKHRGWKRFTSLPKVAELGFQSWFSDFQAQTLSSYTILTPSHKVPLLIKAAVLVPCSPAASQNLDLSRLFPTINTLLSCLSPILMLLGYPSYSSLQLPVTGLYLAQCLLQTS